MGKLKLLALTAVLAAVAGMAFTSYRNAATGGMGLFMNELDFVLDPLYIGYVAKNTLGVQFRMTPSVTSWDVYGGLIGAVPVKIGARLGSDESYNNATAFNETVSFLNLDGDPMGTLETKRVNDTSQINNADTTVRNLTLVAGLDPMGLPMGLRYTLSMNNNVVNATYAVTATGLGAVSTSTEIKDYDSTNLNLLSDTATLYGLGRSDTSSLVHTLTYGIKMGTLWIWVPVSWTIANNSQNACQTNYVTDTNTANPSPMNVVSAWSGSMGSNNFDLMPSVTLFVSSNSDLLLAVNAGVACGLGFYGGTNNMDSVYTSTGVYHAFGGLYVSTSNVNSLNVSYRNNYSYLPLGAGVYPYFVKKVAEGISVGAGLNVNYGVVFQSYSVSNTNVKTVIYDDGSGTPNNPANFTSTTTSYNDFYNFNRVYNRFEINAPLGAEWIIDKVFTVRSGIRLAFWYFNNTTETDYTGTPVGQTTTVFGNGASATVNNALSAPTSTKNISETSDLRVYYSGGISIKPVDAFTIDLNISFGGANFFDLVNWMAELKVLI